VGPQRPKGAGELSRLPRGGDLGCGWLLASSAAWPASGAVLGPRVAQVDSADIGGHVEPDQWQPGYRRVQP